MEHAPLMDNNDQISEEEHFHRLFQEVLDYLKDEHSIEDSDVRAAIDRLILSFRYDLGHKFSDVDLTRPDNVCGYLERYAIHGAGLMRYKTLQAFRNCPVLRRMLRQPQLRVVSLGGGPGNDVVGFLSALRELGPRGCRLTVTVVDSVGEWAQCLRLVKHFARVGNFGSVSEMFHNNAVDLKFVQTSLPGSPIDDFCHCEVELADVIVLSKVISVLEYDQKSNLIAYLHHMLKESAMILVVDCPFEDGLWKDFKLLYLSQEGKKYCLYPLEYPFNPHYDGLFPVTSKSQIAVLTKMEG